MGGVLAEAVEDDPQRGLAGLVGALGDADRALGGGEGFVAGEEAEALRLLAQQHRGEIAVADAHLAVVRDGARDAERLQAIAQRLGGFRGLLHALLERDARAQRVGPHGVLEAMGWMPRTIFVDVHALFQAVLARLFQRRYAVLRHALLDLLDSSFIAFKHCHASSTSSIVARVDAS